MSGWSFIIKGLEAQLADPTRNQKSNRFKVLALSFKALVCISLFIRDCVRHSFQVTYGLKAICHERSPIFISIWICPDDLPVSSVRLQQQQQSLSSSRILHAARPRLCCYLHYILLRSNIVSEWHSAQLIIVYNNISGIHYVCLVVTLNFCMWSPYLQKCPLVYISSQNTVDFKYINERTPVSTVHGPVYTFCLLFPK